MIHAPGSLGPALLPTAGFSYAVAPHLLVGLRAAGPGFASDVAAPGGSIAVRQAMAWVDARYEFELATPLVTPFVTAGIGGLYLGVAGTALPPYRGETDSTLAALLAAGAGAALRLGTRVALVADVRILVAAPAPIVRASGAEAARVGRPSLLEQIAVEVAF